MIENTGKKPATPLISIVVLAGPKRKKELGRCLASIEHSDYPNKEIVLVDNSCNPHLSKEVKSRFPNVRMIRLPTNTGIFGFNVGFANARGKYVLALDDDSSLRRNTLRKIADRFNRASKKIGVLALHRFNPLSKSYYSKISKQNEAVNIYGFAGGASVFRREVFERVGYYDSDFFCWAHEDDFAIRAIDAGYQVHFEKDIVIDHYEKKANWRKKQVFLNARNKAWLNIKHFSLIFFPLLIARDIVWISLLPFRRGSVNALFYGIAGYVLGYLNFSVPLKKRCVVAITTQKGFIKNYWLSDFADVQ